MTGDRKMFHYYHNVAGLPDKEMTKPLAAVAPDTLEAEVPDCILKPEMADDFPNYDDCGQDDIMAIENEFGDDLSELFMEKYTAIGRTKLYGYPSFTQSAFYPECACGKTKEFFFQLSSEDPEDNPADKNSWAAHGLMMGDVGNIYYFVCRSCGEKSVESYFDCC